MQASLKEKHLKKPYTALHWYLLWEGMLKHFMLIHTKPCRTLLSCYIQKMPLGAENGAYPPNQNGLIHPQLSLKWAWKGHKNRSKSVHFCPKGPKSLKKTEHVRSVVWNYDKISVLLYINRSISVQRYECNNTIISYLYSENGACPFTFIFLPVSCMQKIIFIRYDYGRKK